MSFCSAFMVFDYCYGLLVATTKTLSRAVVCLFVRVCVCVFVYVGVCICVCMCVHVCVCVFAFCCAHLVCCASERARIVGEIWLRCATKLQL